MEQDQATNTATPGLKYRKRATGDPVPTWCARADAIAAGYSPKTLNLSAFPKEELPTRCQNLWADMLAFVGKQERQERYDGTLGSLIALYTSHADSSFKKLKPSSRHPYEIYARKLKDAYGARRVDNLTGLDLMGWHKVWRKPLRPGAGERLGAATMATNVLKAALAFGQICGFRECQSLLETTRLLALPRPQSRDQAPDAQDVERAREAAHEMGRHRAALAYALQFDTTARQWDIIGEWVPMSDPRPSSVLGYGEKWIGPSWAAIDANGIITITPTKTEGSTRARVSVDLTLCPMVVEEIAKVSPDQRSGPLIINEQTGLPYRDGSFAAVWREVRARAELSPKLWNRDLRAGGLTEGGIAGASADDRAKLAGHSSPKMVQQVYDRDVLVSSGRVAEARAKFRRGK